MFNSYFSLGFNTNSSSDTKFLLKGLRIILSPSCVNIGVLRGIYFLLTNGSAGFISFNSGIVAKLSSIVIVFRKVLLSSSIY